MDNTSESLSQRVTETVTEGMLRHSVSVLSRGIATSAVDAVFHLVYTHSGIFVVCCETAGTASRAPLGSSTVTQLDRRPRGNSVAPEYGIGRCALHSPLDFDPFFAVRIDQSNAVLVGEHFPVSVERFLETNPEIAFELSQRNTNRIVQEFLTNHPVIGETIMQAIKASLRDAPVSQEGVGRFNIDVPTSHPFFTAVHAYLASRSIGSVGYRNALVLKLVAAALFRTGFILSSKADIEVNSVHAGISSQYRLRNSASGAPETAPSVSSFYFDAS